MQHSKSIYDYLNNTDYQNELAFYLLQIVAQTQRDMLKYPEDFREHGVDEQFLDIRLCIDPCKSEAGFEFIFRTGSSDFDQRHSKYCAASCITPETEAAELLEELMNQIIEEVNQ